MTSEAQGAQQAAGGPALALPLRARAAPPARSRLRRLRRADLRSANGWPSCGRTRRRRRTPSSGSPSSLPPDQPGHAGDGDRHRQHGDPRRGPRAVAGAGAGDGRADRGLPRRARLAGGRRVRPHASARRCGVRCRSWSLGRADVATTAAPRPSGGSRPDKHLVAAFYRNTAIHVFVDRAIGELALLAAADERRRSPSSRREAALRLRELLKFDFFFSGRHEFGADIDAELAVVDADATRRRPTPPSCAHGWRRPPPRRAPRAAALPRRLPHRRRPAGRPRRAVQRGRVPRRLRRGGPAVGAPGPDHQRRVGDPRAVQDRPAPRRPPWPARLRRPDLVKLRELFAEELHAAVTATVAIADIERAELPV